MKKLIFLPLLFCAFVKIDIKPIEIGTPIPHANDSLINVMNDKQTTLSAQVKDKGLLVMFSCNTCPFVIANEKRIQNIQKLAQTLKIGMVIINSNEGKRDADDSRSAMLAYGNDHKFLVPYLLDENSFLADAFGATRTPECFLFDNNSNLAYQGAIDDSPKDPKAVKEKYLENAMNALATGVAITTQRTVSAGCTIKRKVVTQ